MFCFALFLPSIIRMIHLFWQCFLCNGTHTHICIQRENNLLAKHISSCFLFDLYLLLGLEHNSVLCVHFFRLIKKNKNKYFITSFLP